MAEEIEIRDITLPYLNKITNFIFEDSNKKIELVQLQFGDGITFVIKSTRIGSTSSEKVGNYSWKDLLDKQVPWSGALLSIFHDLKMELSTYDVFKEGTNPTVTINCSRDLAIVITDSTGLQVIQCSLTGYNKEGDIITIPNRKFGKITGEQLDSGTIKATDYTSVDYLQKVNKQCVIDLNNIALMVNIVLKTELKGSDIALIQHIFKLVCPEEFTSEKSYHFLHDLTKKIENNTCT